MVVTNVIEQAVNYYYAITEYVSRWKSPYKAIADFSGDKDYSGKMLDESSINGFPSNQIEVQFKPEPYRFLICADKLKTGYNELLLHPNVDKILTDIKAVQTLSRLTRSQINTFVLDFANDPESIKTAFADYYILSDETDPNKLNKLISKIEKYSVYTTEDIEAVNKYFLNPLPVN